MEQITIKYSCRECGLEKVECKVRTRAESEDVVLWMENIVGHAVKRDHAFRSPTCMATSIQDLMIPISGAKYIGGPVVQ